MPVRSRSASAAESAHLLRGDLGAGHRLAGALQPPLELRLLVGAGLERGGGLLTGGGAGLELPVERLAAGRDGVAALPPARCGALGVGRQGEVALGAGAKRGERAGALLALALDALGEPLLGTQVSEQLRPPHGLGPSSGASRRRAISHSERLRVSAASAAARRAARRADSASSRALSASATAVAWRSTAARASASSRTACSDGPTSSSRLASSSRSARRRPRAPARARRCGRRRGGRSV
jgi:hypothetical protein